MNTAQSLFPIIFLIFINIFSLLEAQLPRCLVNPGYYTINSTYQSNLNQVLSSLSPNIYNFGYYNASVGQSPDRANAIALCRGDVQLDVCRSCVQNATVDLVRSCPYQMQAYIYEQYCMIRYSNDNIFEGIIEDAYRSYMWSTVNTTNPFEFGTNLGTLLEPLLSEASQGGLLKVAAGNRSTNNPEFLTIYALVQCIPDFSLEECNSCLRNASQYISTCCGNAIGSRVLLGGCNIRYESYPFYNETRLTELQLLLTSPPIVPPLPPSIMPPLPPGNNEPNTSRTIIIVVSAVAGAVTLLVVSFLLLRMKTKHRRRKYMETIDDVHIAESMYYDLAEIKTATEGFSEANKLGQGGFGSVYKGVLPDGQLIAVKRLSRNSDQGDLEFKNEVTLLARLQHRNLVKLMGFSIEGKEKLLVYEFVSNSSLNHYIFDTTKRSQLNWDTRYKIIGGIARGILYLHEDSRLRIIHRDIKPGNILLDREMNPKIADFGMARLFVLEETQANTNRIVGTYGYMAPEYAMYGEFSIKSDVFSFGVLVLEIISGQRNGSLRHGDLLMSAWEIWQKGSVGDLVDPLLKVVGMPRDILRCIHIGLLCVQENTTERPTMVSVVHMLNSFSIVLPKPTKLASVVHNEYDLEAPLLDQNSNSNSTNPLDQSSQNGMSITNELHGL